MQQAVIGISVGLAAVAALTSSTPPPSLTRAQRAALFAHVPAQRVRADTDGNRLFDDLESRLSAATADQTLDVIIRYQPGREPAQIAGLGQGVSRLPLDHSVVAHLTRDAIRRLATSDAVVSIEEDAVFHATRESAEATTGVTQAAVDFDLKGDGDGDPASYTPKDHTIALIDTGIDAHHQDFAGGKIIGWNDFVNKRPDPYDDEGHGTHCASIAAGAVNSDGVGGVAPDAALVGLKALDSRGAGRTSAIASAIDWCISHQAEYGIEVINMSLGDDHSSSGTDALSRAVNRAAAAGIVVCVAAGNSGPDLYTTGSPAAAAQAITVGSVADPGKGGFFLDRFSSRGPTADGRVKPDLCAPGYQILAARAGTVSGYVRFSGTSMATPFVAGVAALMREANPNLTPADIKEILKQTAVHFGSEGENNEAGAGQIDGYAALEKAVGKSGSGPVAPGHLHATGHLDSTGATATWEVRITDPQFPIAATMLVEGDSGAFSMEMYDPSGRRVGRSASRTRQQTASFGPDSPGTYTVVVRSTSGAVDYSLDVSAGATEPLKVLQR